MKTPLFLIQCVAAAVMLACLSVEASAQQRTGRECEADWKANKATIQQSGKRKKDFITECRLGQTAAASPSATAPSAPAQPNTTAAAPAAPSQGTSTPQRPNRRATAVTAGAGEFATEMEAKSHCPGDTVVWANTRSKVYHFAGTRSYGNTKKGAYMCERDTASAGLRSAKNEKRPQ
jgi:plastocyanin